VSTCAIPPARRIAVLCSTSTASDASTAVSPTCHARESQPLLCVLAAGRKLSGQANGRGGAGRGGAGRGGAGRGGAGRGGAGRGGAVPGQQPRCLRRARTQRSSQSRLRQPGPVPCVCNRHASDAH
jgi:hypothetical protein